MAYASVFRTDRFSVGIGQQDTDINTATSTLFWSNVMMPQVTYEVSQSAVPRSTAASGARSAPLPGRVLPRLALKGPMSGQLTDYDITTDTPDFYGMASLLRVISNEDAKVTPANPAGTSIAYQANGYATSGSDGNTVTLNTATGKLGCYVAFRDDDDGAAGGGFITALSGGGPYTATLFEDLGVQPDNNAERIPTTTMFPSGEGECCGWTVVVSGEFSEQKRTFIGFVPDKISLSVEDGILMLMAEGPCYGGEVRATSGGGLQALGNGTVDHNLLAAIRDTSRVCFGSQSFNTALDDGTVDPMGSYGIRNLVWEWTLAHHPFENPAGTIGFGAIIVGSAILRASFAVPDIDIYKAGAEPDSISAWENRTALSLSAYYGNAAGKLLAINLPAGIPETHPDGPQEIDGVWYWPVTLASGVFTGDTGTGDAADTSWRVGAG